MWILFLLLYQMGKHKKFQIYFKKKNILIDLAADFRLEKKLDYLKMVQTKT